VIGNVSGTPAFELVFATTSQVHVVDRAGVELANWPKTLKVSTTPALADLDHDGLAEIVIGAKDSSLIVYHGDGTGFPGWPVKLGGAPTSQPAIGDVDGDGLPDIVVGATDGFVYAFTLGGTAIPGFPVATGGAIHCAPALADFDGDGKYEIVIGSDSGKLFAWHGNGAALAGWPVTIGSPFQGSVAIAAVTGDGTLEVAACDVGGGAHLLRVNGTEVPGWPRSTGSAALGGPTLGDPDHDGRAEYIAGGDLLSCWDLGANTYDAARRPWYTAGRSFLRQSNVVVPAIDVGPAGSGPHRLALAAGANPLRLGGALRFTARGKPGAPLEIGLFDPAGRRVRAASLSFGSEGSATWIASDRGFRAGVYFLAARSQGESVTTKIVFVP
jgi:hypothetical protein